MKLNKKVLRNQECKKDFLSYDLSHFFKSDKLQTLMNTVNGYEVYTLDSNGIIVSTNLESVNITGYEEWEVIGKSISILYSPIEQIEGKPYQDLETAVLRSSFSKSEIKYKKRNTAFLAIINFTHFNNPINSKKSFQVVIQDSTHSLINEKKIQIIQDEYLSLLNNPFVGIFKADFKKSRIVVLNEKAKQVFELVTNDQILLRSLFASKDLYQQFLNILSKDKRIEDFIFQLKSGSVLEKWISISCSYTESTGLIEGIVSNVTHNNEKAVETQKLKAQLNNFLYHASHDLRSPLTSILGLTNLARLENTPTGIKLYTNLIDDRVKHLDGILHELVSIVYNNSSPVRNEEIDIAQIVDSINHEVKVQNPSFQLNIKIKKIVGFYSDGARIRTILKNLILHSIKHKFPDDFKLRILIRVIGDSSRMKITFRDNATIVTEDSKKYLFTEFYRSSESSTGSGLSLFIVKSMITTLLGKISAETDNLTCFTIELPNLLCIKNIS